MPDDIVRDFMRRYRKRHPELDFAEILQFERSLRNAWGGQRVYVPKDPAAGKALGLALGLRASRPIHELTGRLRIGRRNAYYLLHRRWVSSY